MTKLVYHAMPTEDAEAIWQGGADSYGLPPETIRSTGSGYPCRHCLQNIDAGEDVLVFAYRPFPEPQPYAETGPIFLHARRCGRYLAEEIKPPVLQTSPDYILRGYSQDDRIVYGTGKVIPKDDIEGYAASLFAKDDIAYIHVRSARNNCFQSRIDRA
jgi:hypothetical protein